MLLSTVFLLMQALVATTQTVHIQSYLRKDGLISHNINCATQDSLGYIWLGSEDGVSKFDGKTFENFTTDDGLCDNEILEIAIDQKGRIWFLSVSGCFCFYHKGRFYNKSNTQALDIHWNTLGANQFVMDNDGNFSCGGNSQQMVVIEPDLSSHVMSANESINPFYLELNGVKRIWSGRNQWEVLQSTGQWHLKKLSGDNRHVHSVGQFGNGYLMVTDNGIEQIANNESKVIVPRDSLSNDLASFRIHSGPNESFWITSSSEGAEYYELIDGRYVKTESNYSKGWITDILVDRDGNQWYCTRGDGVRRVTPTPHLQHHRLGNNEAGLCLEKDKDGHVWAGTNKGMVYQFVNDQLSMVLQMVNKMNDKSVKNFIFDNQHNLWCAGLEGVYQFSDESGFWNPAPKNIIPFNALKNICLGTNGNLICSSADGIVELQHLNGENFHLDTLFRPVQISGHPFSDSSNRLWLDQTDRLYYFEDKQLNLALDSSMVFSNKISGIAETPDHYLVISTYGSGLIFIKDRKEAGRLNKSNGLPTNQCGEVYIDGNQHYLATNSGLFVYTFDQGKATINYTITTEHGLPTNYINDVVVTNDKFYLATTEGVVMIDKNATHAAALPPPLHWLSFAIGSENMDLSTIANLDYTRELIRVAFNAITFDRPNELEYEYKLNANDNEWVKTASNVLEFLALPAGDYNLMVRARKFNSAWSEPIVLSYKIKPPYYATSWFRVLLFMVLSSIILLIYRFYANRKYEQKLVVMQREQAVLSERNRIALDMHDDLGSELSNIVILSRIATTKLGLNNELASPVNDINRAATNTSGKMNEIIWALNPANDSLENLVAYLQRFGNDFLELHDMSGTISVPDQLPHIEVQAQRRRNIFLIVKECFHNIQKHANATRADMTITWEENALSIRIKDNGKGFNEDELKRAGNGLLSMRKRAADIHGQIDITSKQDEGAELQLQVRLDE